MNALGQTSKPTPADDQTINAGNLCNPARFPASKGDPPSCCQQGKGEESDVGSDIFEVIPPPPQQPGILVQPQPFVPVPILSHRQVGIACTNALPSPGTPPPTNCFVSPTSKPTDPGVCQFGPCGVRIVQTWTANQAVVFTPNTERDMCGYETRTNPGHVVGVHVPELYIFDSQDPAHQLQYPPVTAGCLYNACLEGGTPVVEFTIKVVANGGGTGQTSIAPVGMTLIGAASATFPSTDVNDPVTITAVPVGALTQASISGACHNAGGARQTIACTIPPPYRNTAVTVTYRSCSPHCTLPTNPIGPVETH
jgi:hypothetical protein